MALIQVRVFDVRIVATGDEPGPAETYVDGGAIHAPASVRANLRAINPGGGKIVAAVAAPVTVEADLKAVQP